jgi:hypothetical protein
VKPAPWGGSTRRMKMTTDDRIGRLERALGAEDDKPRSAVVVYDPGAGTY